MFNAFFSIFFFDYDFELEDEDDEEEPEEEDPLDDEPLPLELEDPDDDPEPLLPELDELLELDDLFLFFRIGSGCCFFFGFGDSDFFFYSV